MVGEGGGVEAPVALPAGPDALDDSGWAEMRVPGSWSGTEAGPVNGAVWFRRDFELPPSADGQPAKLQVGRSARSIGQEAIQMHGGIGMTAEYPVGHYVSRLTAIEHTLGSTEDHLRVLAGAVAEHERVDVTGD